MLQGTLFFMLLTATATLTGPAQGQVDAILSSSAFRAGAWTLLARGGFGNRATERAAFLVRRSDGAIDVVEWPFQSTFLSARWEGRIPDGAIAILHTHPNVAPYPSPNDVEVARQIKLPVFVITRRTIAWTEGQRSKSIWIGAWSGPQDAFAVACLEQGAAARRAP